MAVIIYAFPNQNESKLKGYVYPYVYPYFHQSWSMFVPIPKQNYNVYVKHDGKQWHDVFNEIVVAHQSNRLAGHENISLSLSSAIRYYASSVESKNTYGVDDGNNINLNIIKKIVVQYLTLKKEEVVKNTEMIIRIRDISGHKDNSHYYKFE